MTTNQNRSREQWTWRYSLVLSLLAVGLFGCEERKQLTDHQVNELLRLPAESASASRAIVEHDARSRAEWLALNGTLANELAEVGRRQEQLELRRLELSRQRRSDPIVAAAIEHLGSALLCCVPALMLLLIMRGRQNVSPDEEFCDFIVGQVADQQNQMKRINPTSKKS